MKVKLMLGDSVNKLKLIPDNYVDSIVSDPPAAIGFMAKEWDSDRGGRTQWILWMKDIMIEAKRTLKPGGHCLIWSLPRTSHWTATALEDAGFEIRDVITHVFGSGFPKSHNISKAIDKKYINMIIK
jgi:site-specific DNA-methyltransferase (adenine-specific)